MLFDTSHKSSMHYYSSYINIKLICMKDRSKALDPRSCETGTGVSVVVHDYVKFVLLTVA